MKPNDQITPNTTTIIEISIALNDRKKRYKIREVINKVKKINNAISLRSVTDCTLLIYGIPE